MKFRTQNTLNLIALFLISLGLAIAASPTYRAIAAPPPPIQTATAASTSIAGEKNKCCFCIFPIPGTRDSQLFEDLCNSCLPIKFPNCDVYDSFPTNDFMPEYIKAHNCRSPISVLNSQHGPDTHQIIDVYSVCQTAYPGCSIIANDVSCTTYESEEKAQEAIKYIKSTLPEGGRVEICGSGSVHVWSGCTSTRIVKKFVISPTFTKEELGMCPPFASECRYNEDGNKPFRCLDTLGRTWSIPCCKVQGDDVIGYWGNEHGCAGNGCTTTECPKKSMCDGNTATGQYCSEIGPKGVCIKWKADCWAYKKQCTMVKGTASCFARPTPIPSRTPQQ